MNLKQMLVEMLNRKASDLHIRVGNRPHLRVNGKLEQIATDPVTIDLMDQIVSQILNEKQLERFNRKREMDLALSVAKLGRFRINLFRQRGTSGVAIRAVNTQVPGFEELNLPPVIKKLAAEQRGLIVLTGTTGSGKSTTLASMIEHMNSNRNCNILTVEDPIEYIYRDKKSIIGQREVGGDTDTFASALRHAFRQDPDVILIGEVRDLETMSIALTAADTGHLVLTSLHTLNVVETVTRIISFFPPHQHQQIRLLLGGTLKSIVCQRLLARSDMPGRVPALEILINTGAIRECILDPEKTSDFPELMEQGGVQYGMQTFDQSIMGLYKQGMISFEEAMIQATNPDDFDLRVRGVTGTSDRWGSDDQQDAPAEESSSTDLGGEFTKY
ncbi:MAG: PilT/PilU family type 4a pilus ATPase [candidate division Zixibacteria bacterium]|nr:PilT/PilU family type 4a pilus ATPase [candidate division Zixibacteria bacterium]MDH3936295.1 PilT/PilU family type 4a pilus ATPase [candidate division Zixibacteria bacterium]MDH4034703.1 PilT/PilU family type 4a pilus ATPase [candidate division Zixibacteria bacterium]